MATAHCRSCAALVVLYLPILAAFVGELHRGVQPSHSILGMLLTGIYNLYCIFVSESVAPWFWALWRARGDRCSREP